MTTAIACPKCQTRYGLPDNLLGKPVKCKSCGAMFQTKAPSSGGNPKAPQQQALVAAGQRQAAANRPAQPSVSPEMARLGLDGISHKPEIFGEERNPRAGDPLGNHVVQDPGFADLDTGDIFEVEGPADPAEMFRNPALSPAKPKRKKSSGATSGKTKGKKKRKKRKIHPAVKESLDKSTLTLFIIGALTLMMFGFFFFTADQDAAALIGEGEEAEVAAVSWKVINGTGMVIGGLFCVLGLGVQLFPITCSMLAIIFYVGIDLTFMLLNPFLLFDMYGWIIRIVIIGALGKGFMDALNAGWFEKAQREREAARGEV